MPVSVRRHNLVRLRDELNLTQGMLASWVGRSGATIKSIETGRLALSPKLATFIASVTGADADWLLRNDLSEPMPPLKHESAKFEPSEDAYIQLCVLLIHLFDRLFALAARLKKEQGNIRSYLEWYVQSSLEGLKAAGQIPDCEHGTNVGVEVFEFFKAHPELLDPDLAGWIDLDFLLKDAYRVAARIKVYDRRHDRRFAGEAKVAKELLKLQRLKSQSRTPESPSPDGRHKKPKSS